jgi:hypothetical protein
MGFPVEVAGRFKFKTWLKHMTVECKDCGTSKAFDSNTNEEMEPVMQWMDTHHWWDCPKGG